jgi:hypothetical protein
VSHILRRFKVLASAGPLEAVLKDNQGKMKSFAEVMYSFYSWDARGFLADRLKYALQDETLFNSLPPELQKKARGIIILELVTLFCQSAEDLAAFGISFAAELYRDSVSPADVWKRLAEYDTGQIDDFYKYIQKRGPEYFANLRGYPPLRLQRVDAKRILLRSCKQLAAYLSLITEAYSNLLPVYYAYKHGMRIFFATLKEGPTEIPVIIYIDRDTRLKSIAFPTELIEQLYNLRTAV